MTDFDTAPQLPQSPQSPQRATDRAVALTRRRVLRSGLAAMGCASAGLATLSAPRPARAETVRQIGWEDLIPPGVAYAEIVGAGEMNIEQDTWKPLYDENATKLNTALNGAYIKMPGYIIPLDMGAEGVNAFMLVPYVGACIHTPPPPPNQLVYVVSDVPWPGDDLWNAVWVTGYMHAQLTDLDLAQTGYSLRAEQIETYEW